MRWLTAIALGLGLNLGPAWAQDVIVLGEVHDNPAHHTEQAARVEALKPAALVFEMLDTAQAGRVTPDFVSQPRAMAEALEWADSGWPDFSMYHPIFAAAPEAAVHGAALPRAAARKVLSEGVEDVFGPDAARYGLTEPLGPKEQAAREALQDAAHCGALPEEMLPQMVMIQRVRDAMLARAALDAMAATGGPVAVITGNGHARKDWGMPALLMRVAPELDLHVLGQTEDARPLIGGFDEVLSAPAAPRDDPCAAFRQ